MARHGDKVNVAHLSFRKRAAIIHAGATNVPRRLIEDQITSEIVELRESEPRGQLRAEKVRLKAIRAEDVEILVIIAERKKKAALCEKNYDEAVADRRTVENERLPAYLGKGHTAIMVAFVAADGSFMYWAFCDVAGIDLTRGFSDLSIPTAFMIGLVSLLGVAVNSFAGFLATSPAPRTRLVGWAALLTIAVTLGVMRSASAPETNIAFTIFGCIVTLVAGYVAGAIQRRLLPIIAARRAHCHHLAVTQKTEVEAKAKLSEEQANIEQLEARRRELKAEAENIASMPARRAARKTELGRLQDGRVKAARYYHALGQRLFGRKPVEEDKEVPHA